ncbi:MAG: GIY-YIG nuclease family protein [Bacteroidota bacterium]
MEAQLFSWAFSVLGGLHFPLENLPACVTFVWFFYLHTMWFVYAIKSIDHNYIYVGLSNNVERRLMEHNKGYNRSTKAYRPFFIIYTESFATRIEARKKEKFLKAGSGKKFLRSLL